MPRSNRPRRGGRPRPGSAGPPGDDEPLGAGVPRTEEHPDGEWTVRPVSGAGGGKTYRCPGCSQQIPPGTPHLVCWPAEPPISAFGGVADRRHWHSACWTARNRRRRG